MTTTKCVWVEIPVLDMDRAVRFYETVLGCTLERSNEYGAPIAFFGAMAESWGCLIQVTDPTPVPNGVCCYIDTGEDIAIPLARVEAAGGAVLSPKRLIAPEIGYDATFRDTEGNRVGLWCAA